MIKKIMFSALLCWALFICPVMVTAGPVAEVDEPVYTFDSIVEGQHVIHEFKVKNSGDAVLNIVDVLPP